MNIIKNFISRLNFIRTLRNEIDMTFKKNICQQLGTLLSVSPDVANWQWHWESKTVQPANHEVSD
jgi:hypothetical protein